MAITCADVCIWKQLKADGLIPERPSLLEIGQANWYGDCNPTLVAESLSAAGKEWLKTTKEMPFEIAVNFYRALFDPPVTVAIDFHGQPDALKLDLNEKITDFTPVCVDGEVIDLMDTRIGNYFGVIVNSGTTEHIFSQRQVFETIHDACKVGGLMLHGVPWKGWVDHGFFCYQPTFFYDLAAANGYDILMMAGFELGTNHLYRFKSLTEIHAMERAKRLPAELMLYVVFRKTNGSPFSVPQQGIYNDAKPLGDAERMDWKTMRPA